MMVKKHLFVAIALVLAVSVQGQDDTVSLKSDVHPKPTTTTPKPTQTTTKLTTTTPKATTAPPPETTTKVITTTASPPTSTTPLPPAEKGKWAFTDPKSGATCIILQMAIQMNVTYYTNDSKLLSTVFDLPVNDTQTVDGSCDSTTQFINLQWPSFGNLSQNNGLSLTFVKNETTNKFALSSLEADIIQDSLHFPKSGRENQTLKLVYAHESFTTPLTMSYRCAKTQKLTFENSASPNSTLEISNMQIQAFHTDKGNSFGNANDCDYVDVPDVVPIAVGCALGGLVLIVLIVYLIGRRRNQARGYLSM